MDTLIAFLLASLVTFFFVRGYLRKLTAAKPAAAHSAAPRPMAVVACPRCSKQVTKDSSFCSHCGAALAMWKVQRAEVRSGGVQTGKPKPVINASLCVGCGSCVEVCPDTGTLEMHGHKAILVNPDLCTGHARCKDVCPTQAISLAFDGVLQTVKVPNVNEQFETNVQGVYIVGELGGMGLIKTAVNEGKLAIDHIHAKLERQAPSPNPESFDVAIVGAGPAGLSATLSAQQYGMRYLTIEQGEIASTIRQYPRHKFLMAEPIDIPLFGNLYVGDGSKESLLAVWEAIVKNTGVDIRTNERLQSVQRNGTGFYVESSKGRYHARSVVLAVGRRGTPKKLGVQGEDLAKVSYKVIEAETYQDCDALVVGGGDSAIEAALALSRQGTNRVTLCHRGESFQKARERNQQFLKEAETAGSINVVRNAQVVAIEPDSVLLNVGGAQKMLKNDFVFPLIGGESPDDFLRKIGIEIVEKALG